MKIQKSSVSIYDIDFESDEKFQTKEQQIITLGLKEIKGLIKEQFNFSIAELELINGRIDYLQNSTENLSKTDWKGILFSTILSIITALSLDTEKGEQLIQLFSKIIQSLPSLSL